MKQILVSSKISIPRPLGKNQLHALDFIRRCNGWHSYSKDAKKTVESLAKRGLVENSIETRQFRAL